MRNVTIVLAVLALAVPAQAEFNVVSGDYNTAGNWTEGSVPAWALTALVRSDRTAQISGQIPDAAELKVGWGTNGHLEMSAGQIGGAGTGHDAHPWFFLGGHNGLVNAATFKQTGGNIKSARIRVGEGVGWGEWTISGGSVDAGFLVLGNPSGKGLFKIDNAATGGPSSIAFSSDYTQDAGSTLKLVFGGSAPITKISVAGTTTLAGTLTVTGSAVDGTYTIIDYAGTLTGTFDTVNLPTGWTIDYGDGTNDEVTITIDGSVLPTKIVWQGDDATNPNSWTVAENWDLGHVPPVGTGNTDTIKIFAGVTCKIKDGNVDLTTLGYDQIYVYKGAALELVAGRTLKVRNPIWLGSDVSGQTTAGVFTQWGTFESNSHVNVGAGVSDLGKYVVKGGTINITSATQDFTVGATGTFRVEGSAAASIGLGDYIQNTTGTMELVFDGDNDPIQKIDAATATLAGTLKITGFADAGTYTIIDYAGTLTGTFGTVNLPTGWTIDYGDGTDDLVTVTAIELGDLEIIAFSSTVTSGTATNKINDQDLMYLMTQNGAVTFQVTATGAEAYEWQVNKVVQAGVEGSSFAWTVPNEKGTWEIHLKVTGGGDEAHQEWVVSTLTGAEAPDFFDYFTDGKILGTRETDPWARAHAECITYTDFDGQCPRRFLRRSGSYGPFAKYSGSSGTIVFKFRYTKPYTSTAYGSAVGASWTCKWDFNDYEFGIGLSKQNEGHFYAGRAGDGGGRPMIEDKRFSRRPKGEVMKSYGRSMDLAFLNYGGNPGVQGKESYNVGWHEMRMIYDGRFYHAVVDGRVYPRFAAALVEPEKGGNFFKTREGENLITSIRMSATAWDYSDPSNEGWLDCMEVYTDKYLYPSPRIVVENYPEHYQWNATNDKLIPVAFRSGIVISGRNSQGGPITLADIATAINDPAVFSYDSTQKIANCYTNLKIDTGSFLELKDETLNMHSADVSNELRLASPADLRVIRSKIIGVNKPFRWAIPSEWEPTLYPWGYPKPDSPDFWFENGEDEYVFRGRFEIEDSEIGPCGFLYMSSPLTLSLKNTKLDLVTMDAYPNPYEANSKKPRLVSGTSHSFGMRLQLMVDDFALENLDVTGPDAANPITWILLGGDQVCKFKTIKDSRFKDTNISLRYGVDKVGPSWDRSSFGVEPYTNTLCMLNTHMDNGAVSLDTRDTRLMSKYYTNVKVINTNGEPVEGAKITITNEQDNDHYPAENLNYYRTYTTWHEEGHFSYGSGQTTLVQAKGDPLDDTATDATGLSPLPSEQPSTIVLTDYVKYNDFRGKLRGDFNNIDYGRVALKVAWLAMPVKTGQVDFTYAITAEKDAESKTVTGINPGPTWYRPDAETPTHTVVIVLGGDVAVCNRRVFYNNSAFDGNNAAANTDDDGAIAPDKTALLPGETAKFANYTSYSRGINGIMVDVVGLPGIPTAADFTFKVGNDNNTAGWAAAPAPTNVTVRPGAGLGGSDRITIIWADNAIQKQWLQVTVKATTATGLASDDVFYFGNAIGETGNSATDAMVKPTDEIGARNNPHTLGGNPADIDDAYDFDRDKKVGPTDEIIARNNGTNSLTALKLITAP